MNDAYQGRSLREIARILFQHWVLMFVIVASATVGTWAYCQFVAKKTYRSELSLIFKRPEDRNPLITEEGERSLEVFVKAQQQIIMSDLVLARAMVISEDDALRDQWYRLRKQQDAERRGRAAGSGIEHDVEAFLNEGPVADRVEQLLTQRQTDFREFRESVELETPGGEQVAMTETFTLKVDRPGKGGQVARFAADIVADMYVQRFSELQQDLAGPAVEVLKSVIDDYKRSVEEAHGGYSQFVKANAGDIGVLEQLLKSGSEHGVQRWLSKIRDNDAELRLKWARDKSVHEVLMDVLPAEAFDPGGVEQLGLPEMEAILAGVPAEFIEANTAIVEGTKHLAKLRARKAKLDSQFHETSRDVQYVADEILESTRDLLRGVVAQASSLGATVAALDKQIQANRELIASTSQQQDEIHRKLAQYAQLKKEFDTAQEHLSKLEREQQEARANQYRAQHAVSISKLSAASTPDPARPVSPKPLLFTIAAFLASSLIAVALAFFLDHFDHTLRSSVEAERYLGLPVLGSVKKHGRGGLLVPV